MAVLEAEVVTPDFLFRRRVEMEVRRQRLAMDRVMRPEALLYRRGLVREFDLEAAGRTLPRQPAAAEPRRPAAPSLPVPAVLVRRSAALVAMALVAAWAAVVLLRVAVVVDRKPSTRRRRVPAKLH